MAMEELHLSERERIALTAKPEDVDLLVTHVRGSMRPAYAKDKERPYIGEMWERQPHETGKSFAGFLVYRNMAKHERTIKAAAAIIDVEVLGKPYARNDGKNGIIYNWARSHRWNERVQAYDAFMDAAFVEGQKRKRIEAGIRHAGDMATAQDVAMHPVKLMAERIAEMKAGLREDELDRLPDVALAEFARKFLGLMPDMQKGERDALGATIEHSDTGQSVDEVRVKAERIRAVLGDPNITAALERVSIEVGKLKKD